MTILLLVHMALWYLPLVTKNVVVINAICDYVLHDWRHLNGQNLIFKYNDNYFD
jgi:hypothetical protein